MKIVYVARHNGQDNDDEGAIAFAFEKLGHTVQRIQDFNADDPEFAASLQGDFCLFHNWDNYKSIQAIKQNMDVYCWFFDKFSFEDDYLKAREAYRKGWIDNLTKLNLITLGFLTDGDQVAEDTTGKLRWLMQGVDERYIGMGIKHSDVPPILFTGTPRHGSKREAHVTHLYNKWGNKFLNFGAGRPRDRLHGRALANLIASTQVVIAPIYPVTDRYWSNRVYLTCGFGGCLLHPNSVGLERQYGPLDLIFYYDVEQCDEFIGSTLNNTSLQQMVKEQALIRKSKSHLYRHRVEEMLKVIKEYKSNG